MSIEAGRVGTNAVMYANSDKDADDYEPDQQLGEELEGAVEETDNYLDVTGHVEDSYDEPADAGSESYDEAADPADVLDPETPESVDEDPNMYAEGDQIVATSGGRPGAYDGPANPNVDVDVANPYDSGVVRKDYAVRLQGEDVDLEPGEVSDVPGEVPVEAVVTEYGANFGLGLVDYNDGQVDLIIEDEAGRRYAERMSAEDPVANIGKFNYNWDAFLTLHESTETTSEGLIFSEEETFYDIQFDREAEFVEV